MAARAVHIAEVNPEKSAPLSSDAGGIKKLQPLIFKGCAVVVTVGLEPVFRSLNGRGKTLERHLRSLLTNKLEALSPSANSPLG